MRIDILTLFPDQFSSVLKESILKIAQEKKLVGINLVNFRDFATDSHHTVDDRPYGGGQGMILKVDILDEAVTSLKKENPKMSPRLLLLSAQGQKFTQEKAAQLVEEDWLILICGHYEGVDQRVIDLLGAEEISVGDFVLSGGEIPAMLLIDSITRLIPGVLGNSLSNKDESFTDSYLEYPQYTRPEEYKGHRVPQVLLSGNHGEIKKWREEKKVEVTKKKRPDLM